MARTVIQVNYGCNFEEARRRAEQILTSDGYCEAEQDGEVIWTKGDVKLTGVRGIKVDFDPDKIKISDWIRRLIGGETPLHGFAGAVTKRDVKKTMDKLRSALSENGF